MTIFCVDYIDFKEKWAILLLFHSVVYQDLLFSRQDIMNFEILCYFLFCLAHHCYFYAYNIAFPSKVKQRREKQERRKRKKEIYNQAETRKRFHNNKEPTHVACLFIISGIHKAFISLNSKEKVYFTTDIQCQVVPFLISSSYMLFLYHKLVTENSENFSEKHYRDTFKIFRFS